MSEYDIGWDVQDLRSRLERLEAGSGGAAGKKGEVRGASALREVSGGLSEHPPVLWKLEAGERLPPFALSLLRLPFPMPHRLWPGSCLQ
jgi:hypothetical protein